MSPEAPLADVPLSEDPTSRRNWIRLPFLLSRLFLGGVFVYASYDKIIHPVSFAEIVYNYQILPDGLLNLVALFLPWMELLVGLLLILGLWLPGAVLACNFLLLVFFGALVFNMARGLDVDCGCFTVPVGPSSGGHMPWYLFRDGAFLFLGLFLLFSFFFLKTPRGSRFERPWKLLVRQPLVITLLAALLGLLVNQVRPNSMPLVSSWSPEARITLKFGKNILIPFHEARDKFYAGVAVFIDARPPDLYQENHIQGALNVPLAEFDQVIDTALTGLSEEALIVTYCDGEDCDLSAHLALKLKEIGYGNVRVLHNGWSLWKNHQLPLHGVKEQEG